jgi:hypothetical protein
VGPITCRDTRKRNSRSIGKKRNQIAKQTPLNFETIKRLIKQKTQEKFSQEATGKTSNLHGKTTKTNPENKQWHISGSTQVTTASQHTSITSKYSVIINAQYAN